MREENKKYFESLQEGAKKAYELAGLARKEGFDPEEKVEIPVAKDMAERVEGLISTVAPAVAGSGIPKRIRELEEKYGILDWRVSLIIAEEIAKGKFCKFEDKMQAIEVGVRVGFAYHTLGTVSSPLEGFVGIKLKKTKEGKDYFALQFSGPIRSAGGTGASVSVLIADHVRRKMGYEKYDPSEEEIKRMSTELYDYHERITNLQYLPSKEEIEFIVRNLPVQIDGDPSEKIEVSNYKDLQRIETKRIRNGVCLVLGEGIAQKAPKLSKQLTKWGGDFGLDEWEFIKEFVDMQKKIKAKSKTDDKKETDNKEKVLPDYTFIKDLVGGRPIFTHPKRIGGFRLRYGRSRTSGFSSYSIHPSTMFILNDYLAIGTQLKNERPGKGCTVTVCDSIEGPTVLLENGNVIRLQDPKDAKSYASQIKEIIFLGDILINFGDFFNRAHKLVPPGYCEEWWVLEIEKATVNMFGSFDIEKLTNFLDFSEEKIRDVLKGCGTNVISVKDSLTISKKLNVPLHPTYSYYWSTISKQDLKLMINSIKKGRLEKKENIIMKLIVPNGKSKKVFEHLGIPHILHNNEFLIFDKENSQAICASFSIENISELDNILEIIDKDENLLEEDQQNKQTVLDIINIVASTKIKDKAGIFIGARMGRPEKAKMRQLTGSPHVLFPVGEEGGRLRCFQAALDKRQIESDFSLYFCESCDKEKVLPICDECGKKTKKRYYCRECNKVLEEKCKVHDVSTPHKKMLLDINSLFQNIVRSLEISVVPELIKGVRGTSNKEHTPEHLAKGILRAKHKIYVNKDGTIRYDMTQLGITHFKPKEIQTSIDKLKEMGYLNDIYGNILENPDQILEIKAQDIILPASKESPDEGADEVMFRTARFVDELLIKFYKKEPFYGLKEKSDMVGHLVIALAPHTSAAILGRIIGFSKTQGFFAHPLLHAATRRDLDGDEACVILLMDALLNFSKKYLPAHRGSTQDAPLVLTTQLRPTEVDDMVFDMDIEWKYPLEFYEACEKYKEPWDIKLNQISNKLGKEDPYTGVGFTHHTSDINEGVRCSAYKTLPSMADKLNGQMEIAEKTRAVDEGDVARLVIEKHFLKDIKGNLRKFSTQQFRCVACNKKYRRPPLIGKCTSCGGKIIFTISEGSVIKYFKPSLELAEKYPVPNYLKQTLELTKRRIEGVFGKEKEVQEGLNKWFSG